MPEMTPAGEKPMKSALGVFPIVVLLTVPLYAQGRIDGTWQAVAGKTSWTVVLRSSGSTLTGVATGCGSGGVVDITDGTVENTTFTFTCKSGNGDNTLRFAGTVSGDRATLTWTHEVRGNNPLFSCCATSELFGRAAPPRFIAHRIPDGELAQIADQVAGSYYSAAANLRDKDVRVEATLFLPIKVSRVRAVFVVSSIGLGDSLYRDEQIRKLLETTQSAILYARFNHISTRVTNTATANAADGSDVALFTVLTRLAGESSHQELAAVPLLFWAHSAAGPFGPTFAALHPERTIAFVGYHSGGAGQGGGRGADIKVISQIPALLFANGGEEDPGLVNMRESFWKRGRELGAPWTFAVEPGATHGDAEDLKKANALLLPWVTAVLRQRLSTDGSLRSIPAAAWLGNIATGEVGPIDVFRESKVEAVWLPDEVSARAWQQVVRRTNN